MNISDLLVRHEKLVHLNESSKENTRPQGSPPSTNSHKASLSDGQVSVDGMGMHGPPPAILPPPQVSPYQPPPIVATNGGPPPMMQDSRMQARLAACNLDVLSHAALASESGNMSNMMAAIPQQQTSHARAKSFGEPTPPFPERPREDPTRFAQSTQAPPAMYDSENFFLDSLGTSAHFLPPHFETQNFNNRPTSKPAQFPPRFGQIMSDEADSKAGDDGPKHPPLYISNADHAIIKAKFDSFASVLPDDFVFPSKVTFLRWVDGYISGFHDQLPFLHLPTLSPVNIAPELILAILAVGAQYRFESERGYALWYAAKAVAMEQIRRRHSAEVHALLPNAASYSPQSTRPSPTYRHSFASGHTDRSGSDGANSAFINTPQARLETIQAVLLLFAVGLWSVKRILHEALALQSSLAMLIREEGLHMDASHSNITDWETWIHREGALRTKLIAFCFFNLCSTAYDMPPVLLTPEIHLFLPLPARLWRAENAWQWQELRQSTHTVEITLHEAFTRLFSRSVPGLPPQLSTLGNYILINALIQHIYLLKQTSFMSGGSITMPRSLKPDDVEEVAQALSIWQSNFEERVNLRAVETSNFSGADTVTGGSLVYNATALLRLAFIRLYTDKPPSRALETRDSMAIASAMANTPPLTRGPRLHRAVYQVIHALSVLVKAGVNYVARTKSTEWSIQHSICNLECAILLAKWLLTLSVISPSDAPVSLEEKQILDTVRRLLDETEFAVPFDATNMATDIAASDAMKLRQLAGAVVRLWAETFKGTHIFDMVKVMGGSLDIYADLAMKSSDRGAL